MLTPYRVLDLTGDTDQLAGQFLAGLGAEVILIEPPGGAKSRRRGPHVGDEPGPERAIPYLAYNRGKKGVVLDLDTEDGQRSFRALAASADVLIESDKPGMMNGRGLGPDDLAELNPGLVYVSISAFGQDGPKAGYESSDLTLFAAGVTMSLTGDEDRAPLRISIPQARLHAATTAASGALVALTERAQSGRGQHVDISIQQVLPVATLGAVLAHAVHGAAPGRSGGGVRQGPIDLRFVWPAKDGFISMTHVFGPAIGPVTARLMAWVHEEGFCDEATRDKDWVDYGMMLSDGREPIEEFDRVKACIAAFTSTKTKAELLEGAMERRLLIAPTTTCADVAGSEQLAHRQFWEDVDYPHLGVTLRHPGAIAGFSATPMTPLGRAPTLGEHTDEILAALPGAATAVTSPPPGGEAEPSAPLEGLKVLDLMWAVAGPGFTRTLADFGATVVRVESVNKIDAARAFGPFINNDPGADGSALFQNVNAGKLGMALDLTKPGAIDVVKDLIRWADVLTEAFSPRAMAAWGLTYEEIKELNPNIIMLSSCLMGQSGPLAMFAGYGNLAGAIMGFYSVTGWNDRAPTGPYGAYTDYIAPAISVTALLAALDHRRRTGEGQYIDFSQGEGALSFLATPLVDFSANGRDAQRQGNSDLEMAPHGVYRAAGVDEWVAVACETDEQWAALAAEMGDPTWTGDTTLGERANRLARREELDAAVEAWTTDQDPNALEVRLQASGVPAHRVLTPVTAFGDEQLEHRGHWLKVEHSLHGETTVEINRTKLSRTPARTKRGAPTIGEHTFEILTDILGYDGDQIAELAAAEMLE